VNDIKALIIVPTDRLGGAETNLKRIALEVQKKGAELTVIFLSRGDHGRWSEVDNSKSFYINSPRESLGFIKALILFIKWRLMGKVFDYSFTSHSHCNAYIGFLIKIRVLKVNNVVYRESSNHFTWLIGKKLKFFKWMYKFYAKYAFIICQTEKMKNELLIHVTSIKNKQVKVIPNPVNYAVIRNKSKEIEGFNQYNSDDYDYIVAVGRLVPQKDYPTLIKAFSQFNNSQLRLMVIGSGPELDSLQILVSTLRLDNSVIFLGHIDNPAPFMRNAKLCVMSSKLEGYPNVLLEMMCVAKRVVAAECTDGIKGLPGIYTCSHSDYKKLYNAMNEALITDNVTTNSNIKKMRLYVKTLTISAFVESIIENSRALINK
jgi:glycosyltransferase involved in cell wall biosynthesis